MPRSKQKWYLHHLGFFNDDPIVGHLEAESAAAKKSPTQYVTDLLLQRDRGIYGPPRSGVEDGWYPRGKVLLDLTSVQAMMAVFGMPGLGTPSDNGVNKELVFDDAAAMSNADDALDFL